MEVMKNLDWMLSNHVTAIVMGCRNHLASLCLSLLMWNQFNCSTDRVIGRLTYKPSEH